MFTKENNEILNRYVTGLINEGIQPRQSTKEGLVASSKFSNVEDREFWKYDINFSSDDIHNDIIILGHGKPESYFVKDFDFRNGHRGTFYGAYAIHDDRFLNVNGNGWEGASQVRTNIYHWFKAQPDPKSSNETPLRASLKNPNGGIIEFPIEKTEKTKNEYKTLIQDAIYNYKEKIWQLLGDSRYSNTCFVAPESKSSHVDDLLEKMQSAFKGHLDPKMGVVGRNSKSTPYSSLNINKKNRKMIYKEILNDQF